MLGTHEHPGIYLWLCGRLDTSLCECTGICVCTAMSTYMSTSEYVKMCICAPGSEGKGKAVLHFGYRKWISYLLPKVSLPGLPFTVLGKPAKGGLIQFPGEL